jgi:aminopeptidase N
MAKDRSKVFAFEKTYHHAVVDTNYRNLNDILNPNSYQKGSWVLHMLRRELGDSLFQLAIQNYYGKFRLSNAETADLKLEMEKVSGKDLEQFFKQWLFNDGHPEVKVKYTQKSKKVTVVIEQIQKNQLFEFDLIIRFKLNDGTSVDYKLPINSRKQEVDIELKGKVKSIEVDPEIDLLVEWVK